jgi:hypothetical protein
MYKLFPGNVHAQTCRGQVEHGRPTQMRIEAERGCARRAAAPVGEPDPAQRPPLHSDSADEIAATIDWLAHLAAGRIPVR